MADFTWFMSRLKAMSVSEIIWRISQKRLHKIEEKHFRSHKQAVTGFVFNPKLNDLKIDADLMYLNVDNKVYSVKTSIPLLGGFEYEQYKKEWHAGFQTEHKWPETFSYALEYKQRDDIGDARTNWELNRHFQFALLAKDYMATGEDAYLQECWELFCDWNEKNPFLWGISWTSVMEVAIRCSNWCYTYAFLSIVPLPPQKFLEALRVGIINMTEYITQHYSRYSSANNHLIVEAYAIGQSGILLGHQPWIDLAINILTRELPMQNYADGINKELSLHYQSFYMEAMGLMMRLLQKNNESIPDTWSPMLKKMCRYVKACMGDHGEVIEFGDNDEGKILDLCGGFNHYQYILELFSCLLDERYIELKKCTENIRWLFDDEDRAKSVQKPLYSVSESVCFREGGNSILRSHDGRVLIGIDHAALGYGSIAAHGHADALSFQMFVDGDPIFIDPGTYIYHCDLSSRNAYRKTENHNTVCVSGKDQSEMLGAFLWGKRAECELITYEDSEENIILKAKHNGYSPIIHTRTYKFNKKAELIIIDEVSEKCGLKININLGKNAIFSVDKSIVHIQQSNCIVNMQFESDGTVEVSQTIKQFSEKYGIQNVCTGICLETSSSCIRTIISLAWRSK